MSRGDIEAQTMGKKERKVQATLIINIFVDKSDNASGSGEFDVCFERVKTLQFFFFSSVRSIFNLNHINRFDWTMGTSEQQVGKSLKQRSGGGVKQKKKKI